MTSATQWTWLWASPGWWWRTGKLGMLQSLGLQRVGHDWVTEKQEHWIEFPVLYSVGFWSVGWSERLPGEGNGNPVWTEEPGGLQPMRPLRVRHYWATEHSHTHTHTHTKAFKILQSSSKQSRLWENCLVETSLRSIPCSTAQFLTLGDHWFLIFTKLWYWVGQKVCLDFLHKNFLNQPSTSLSM